MKSYEGQESVNRIVFNEDGECGGGCHGQASFIGHPSQLQLPTSPFIIIVFTIIFLFTLYSSATKRGPFEFHSTNKSSLSHNTNPETIY
jgi:hypothetical protein